MLENGAADAKQTPSRLDALLPRLKDIIAIAPFLGTALAITYDVGFFLGIGMAYFTMFTLSEHIVFALEALPFALIMIASIPVCLYAASGLQSMTKRVIPDSTGEDDTEEEKKQNVLALRSGFVTICVLLIGTAFALVGHFMDSAMAMMAGGVLLGMLLLVQIGAPFEVAAIGSIFAGTFLLTLGLAVDTGRHTFKTTTSTHTLETTSGAIQGLLIRSGERGILFFDRQNGDVVFIRWDGISRIKTKPPQ